MHLRTCKQCGKTFEATSKRPNYCPNSDCYRASERAYNKRQRATYSPQRRRAYLLVHSALNKGELTRRPCEVCGHRRDVVAHHDDYAAPLDVRWLCLSHHKQHHIAFGPGKNSFVVTA